MKVTFVLSEQPGISAEHFKPETRMEFIPNVIPFDVKHGKETASDFKPASPSVQVPGILALHKELGRLLNASVSRIRLVNLIQA